MSDHGQQQPLITSRRNPLVKQLRQLHTTWGRREAGEVLLEGTHLLEEALRHGLALQRLVFTQRWAENHPALLAQVPPWFHQLVSGVATALLLQLPWPQRPRFPLALDHIQDPGNLATLLLTALAAEVDGVMLAQSVDRASREQTTTPYRRCLQRQGMSTLEAMASATQQEPPTPIPMESGTAVVAMASNGVCNWGRTG